MVEEKKPNFFERIFLSLPALQSPPISSPNAQQAPAALDFTDDRSAGDASIDGFKALNTQARGSSGTLVNAGYPAEEYLYTLRGRERANVYEKMRRGDGQISMCLAAVKNPIKSCLWEIDPGKVGDEEKATDEAIKDAAFIKHILFEDLDLPWTKKLSEILTMIDFGHSVFEITHKAVIDHPTFGSYIGIQSLGWRSPRTIERWNLDLQTGKLASITQMAFGDLQRFVEIPVQFLLTFALNQEGSNYEGISMLRPCYGSWKRKELYLKLNAIGIEKFAVQTPLIEVPEDKMNDPNNPELQNVINAIAAYTSGESGYFAYPAGWKIDLKASTFDPSKVDDSVDREDTRMAKAFLCNFLELGMSGGGGAFALSEDLSDFMLDGLEFIAKEVEAQINDVLIPMLIKLNFGERETYPKLKHSNLSDKAGSELANMLKELGMTRWLTPEDGDEDHLRRRMGLPARTRIGMREVANVTERIDDKTAPTPTLSEKIRLAEEHQRVKAKRG